MLFSPDVDVFDKDWKICLKMMPRRNWKASMKQVMPYHND